MADKISIKLRRKFLDTNIPAIPNSQISVKIENGKINFSIPIEVKDFSTQDSIFEYRKTLKGEPIDVQYNEFYIEPIVTKVLDAITKEPKEYSGRVKITAVMVLDIKKPIDED